MNDNDQDNKKPDLKLEIATGIAIPAAFYGLIFLFNFSTKDSLMMLFLDFLIFVVTGFLFVKFSNTGHKLAAKIMFILMLPLLVGLLLFGGCFLTLG